MKRKSDNLNSFAKTLIYFFNTFINKLFLLLKMTGYNPINMVYAYIAQNKKPLLIPLTGINKKEIEETFEKKLLELSGKYLPMDRNEIVKTQYKSIVPLEDILKKLDLNIENRIKSPLAWQEND
jgi:hypothetical protein